MVKIRQIKVNLKTANVSGAGTDGSVYLGICGREFNLDLPNHDDNEQGKMEYYQIDELGQSNVSNPNYNNTTSPQIAIEDVDKLPVYIRFEPHGSGSDWCLEYVKVSAVSISNNQIEGQVKIYESKPGKLWLGNYKAKFVFLKKIGYDARLAAWTSAGWAELPITMDGNNTGYKTPHNFKNITGTHKFTLPETAKGYTLTEWNKDGSLIATTQRTLTVNSHGVYTAQYTSKPAP